MRKFLWALLAVGVSVPVVFAAESSSPLSSLLRVVQEYDVDQQRAWFEHQRGTDRARHLKVQIELNRTEQASEFLKQHPRISNETEVQVVLGHELQLLVTLEDLGWLSEIAAVRSIRLPHFAKSKEYMTEGYEALFDMEDWHQDGTTGEGVRVAVIDIGFQGYQDLIGTELPVDLDDSGLVGDWESDNHGTAVAEIIHDVAPGASIQLYSFETELEFRELLYNFATGSLEADVINASIGFDNVWSVDGSSPYSVGVDDVFDAGIVYIAPAGNEAESYRSGLLTDVDGDLLLEIDGVEGVWVAASGAGGENRAEVSLRWSDPMMESSNDLDLWVTEDDEVTECGRSEDAQQGDGNPFEYVSCDLIGEWGVAWVVASPGADFEGKRAWIYSYPGVEQEHQVKMGTLTLPADARGALTVGAYSVSEDEIAWYSSRGPTEDDRIKPDLVAPTGVSTESMGFKMGQGSSFSAPHLAGLAALVLDRKPSYSAKAVVEFLKEQTRDLGVEGPDNVYGQGAVFIESYPKGCGCRSTPNRSDVVLAMVGGLFLLRRRRVCAES